MPHELAWVGETLSKISPEQFDKLVDKVHTNFKTGFKVTGITKVADGPTVINVTLETGKKVIVRL